MLAVLRLLKATLVGGFLFLLPIGIVLVVFGKLLALSLQASQVLRDQFFPDYESGLVPLLIAIGILVLIALLAGLFARTRLGNSLFTWLEGAVLARLPIYTILRQMLADMAGGAERLAGREDVRVVKVRFDDLTQLGFVVDDTQGEGVVVYLPGAPSALSGTVVLMERERIADTGLTPQQVLTAMRRLGVGLLAHAKQ